MGGTTKSSIEHRSFHYKPSIQGGTSILGNPQIIIGRKLATPFSQSVWGCLASGDALGLWDLQGTRALWWLVHGWIGTANQLLYQNLGFTFVLRAFRRPRMGKVKN